MSEETRIEICNNCNAELLGEFCSNCGRPKKLKKINGQYILSEIGSILNFDKGILYTIKELLLRPGLNVQKFILQDRNRLVKPILFIIVCSLIYTLSQQLFHFEDGYVNYSLEESSNTTKMFIWISSNYGYSNILMALIIAFWIKVFFRKYGYNFFEIIILLCFMMGMGMLMFSIFGILDQLIPIKIIDKGFLIGVLYISWGIARFFDKKKKMNYVKAFLVYMLGMFSFFFIVMILGLVIDSIIK